MPRDKRLAEKQAQEELDAGLDVGDVVATALLKKLDGNLLAQTTLSDDMAWRAEPCEKQNHRLVEREGPWSRVLIALGAA